MSSRRARRTLVACALGLLGANAGCGENGEPCYQNLVHDVGDDITPSPDGVPAATICEQMCPADPPDLLAPTSDCMLGYFDDAIPWVRCWYGIDDFREPGTIPPGSFEFCLEQCPDHEDLHACVRYVDYGQMGDGVGCATGVLSACPPPRPGAAVAIDRVEAPRGRGVLRRAGPRLRAPR